jgi:hypothetical protein
VVRPLLSPIVSQEGELVNAPSWREEKEIPFDFIASRWVSPILPDKTEIALLLSISWKKVVSPRPAAIAGP